MLYIIFYFINLTAEVVKFFINSLRSSFKAEEVINESINYWSADPLQQNIFFINDNYS